MIRRSQFALKEPLRKEDHRPQMDWVAMTDALIDMSIATPYRWIRVTAAQAKRPTPGFIRQSLKRAAKWVETELQIRQVLKGEVRTGDIQPVEWLTNDFEVDSGLVRLERQKKRLGEKVLWETWVRIAPPEALTRQQKKAQDEYTKNLRDAHEREREAVEGRHALQVKLDAMDPYTRQTYWLEDEINSLPNEFKPRKIRELHRRHNARRYEHTVNNRIGREGWREWRVSITKERAEGGMR